MAATKSFAQKAKKVRRVRRKGHSIEVRAANSASQSAERGSELWNSLYEAKMLEYSIDKKIYVMNDAIDSIRLNRKKNVLDT